MKGTAEVPEVTLSLKHLSNHDRWETRRLLMCLDTVLKQLKVQPKANQEKWWYIAYITHYFL